MQQTTLTQLWIDGIHSCHSRKNQHKESNYENDTHSNDVTESLGKVYIHPRPLLAHLTNKIQLNIEQKYFKIQHMKYILGCKHLFLLG